MTWTPGKFLKKLTEKKSDALIPANNRVIIRTTRDIWLWVNPNAFPPEGVSMTDEEYNAAWENFVIGWTDIKPEHEHGYIEKGEIMKWTTAADVGKHEIGKDHWLIVRGEPSYQFITFIGEQPEEPGFSLKDLEGLQKSGAIEFIEGDIQTLKKARLR